VLLRYLLLLLLPPSWHLGKGAWRSEGRQC
jgi:hypothetical protein